MGIYKHVLIISQSNDDGEIDGAIYKIIYINTINDHDLAQFES